MENPQDESKKRAREDQGRYVDMRIAVSAAVLLIFLNPFSTLDLPDAKRPKVEDIIEQFKPALRVRD